MCAQASPLKGQNVKHKVKSIHFVGIGGAGMSGIAEVLLNLGYEVSGSDLGDNAATRRLKSLGARVIQGHAAENVADADAVVTSTAVKGDNPEVIAARARHIPVVPRAQMLAELMRLKQIGGKLNAAGANARLGKGDFLVAEADESDASFLLLTPVISVVTNIDADHMETYGHDFARLKQSFVDFLQHLPFYGVAVLCDDDKHVRSIMPLVSKQIVRYGFSESANVRAENIHAADGTMSFDVVRVNGTTSRIPVVLNLPGRHNVLNALAAIAVASELGVSDQAIVRALTGFTGVDRRFQRYGEVSLPGGGCFSLVDDYGHHPVEMRATIAAARGAFPGRRLLLAFQPHRYTRTRDCFEDFVSVLGAVDALVLSEVYAAGEPAIVAADGRALARALRVAGKVEPLFVDHVGDLPQAILAIARDGDVVMTMGAGSIGAVPGKLVAG